MSNDQDSEGSKPGHASNVARASSFEEKMATIEECASSSALTTERSLLHAFIGCLTPTEVCRGILETLGKATQLGLALRNRLLRMARDGIALAEIDALGRNLLDTKPADSRTAARRNAHLSQLFPHFAPPTRKAVLEHWLDLDTKGALQRWLKAIASDPMFFSIDEVIAYWRRTGEPEAAALIAKHATPEALSTLLTELVSGGAPGWIVSKSALRASALSEEAWLAIRQDMPATYAYLCAKLNRKISDAEALEIIEACDPMEDQGLAIWAVGQLGMWNVLEIVWSKSRYIAG